MTSKVEQSKRWRYKKKTIGSQRRGLKKERTTKNSITMIGGDYSSNRKKGI
jgi:hypothetical protein